MGAALIGLAVLLGSIAVAAAALFIARFARIDHLLDRLSRGTPDLPAMADRFADFADLARKDGMLILESRPETLRFGVLRRGIALALEGHSAEGVRQRLLAQEGGPVSSRPVERGWMLQGVSIAASAVVLILLLAGGVHAGWFDFAEALGALGLLCLAHWGIAIGAGASEPSCRLADATSTAMQIEAAALITAGADGVRVRAAMRAMLPEASSPRPLAQAA